MTATRRLTFPDVLARLRRERPDAVGIVDDAGPHTWREIADEAAAIARALVSAGVAPGDRVAGLLRNRAPWLSAAVGAHAAGATFVPLNTWSSRRELGWVLRHTRARVLLAEEEFLGHKWAEELAAIEPALPGSPPGRLAGSELPDLRLVAYTEGRHPGALAWDEFLGLGSGADDVDRCAPNQPAFVLYTSGSSGQPKGVVLAHEHVLGNAVNAAARRRITADDRIWLGSPLFYGLGATNVLPLAMAVGATLVVQERFTPEGALAAIEEHGCTTYCGTSNMTRRIVESDSFSPGRVAGLVKGNTGIGPAERELVLVRMGIEGACVGYGATETCGMCFIGEPEDPLDLKLETCGSLMPEFEAVVVDPVSGRPLSTGEVGLLQIRGHITAGYLDNAEQNADAFTPDGFYRTGDLASIDRRGYLRWQDRVKEMIKTGGINVSPAEVEGLLLMHPQVSEAYVLGVPDRVQGEIAAAFVVADGPLDEAALRTHVGELAARFKVPAHVVFRRAEDIPRTTSGKVAKQELKAEWARGTGT